MTLSVRSRPDGADRVTVTAQGSIRRSDFGIEPPMLLEAGVSDRVDLAIDVTALRIRGQ